MICVRLLVSFTVGCEIRAGDTERKGFNVVADFGEGRNGFVCLVSDDELPAALAAEGVRVVFVEKRQGDIAGERQDERREGGFLCVDVAQNGNEVVAVREGQSGPAATNCHGSLPVL